MKNMLLGIFMSSCVYAGNMNMLVINGEVVDPATQPQVVKIRQEKGRCTATLVSDRAALTAGHCGAPGDKMMVTYQGQDYAGVFYQHPQYSTGFFGGVYYDYALVLLDEPIANAHKATVSFVAAKKGTEVTFFGYGCAKVGGGAEEGQEPYGTLRKGLSKIASILSYDYRMSTGSAVCFGDSGGPLYNVQTNEVIGVASTGNIKTTSNYAKLSLATAKKFLQQKAEEFKIEICGLNAVCN